MDYEEGLKLGLNKFEIEDIPNMDNSMIASLIEHHSGCVSFIKGVLEQNGKSLDIEGLVDYLVSEIDEPYFDPDHGYEDVTDKKNALKELGYDYDEIKEVERQEEYEDFVMSTDTEINFLDLLQADEELEEFYAENPHIDDRPDSEIPEEIDETLEQWLNAGKSKTPLQEREEKLSRLEKEEKTISQTEKLIEQKENAGKSL